MAAELSSELGIEAELIGGTKGIFDVRVDEELVFSKYEVGRFPEPGEVTRAVGAHEL